MKTLQKQFLPYNLAIKLKELGFDEECIFQYYKDGSGLEKLQTSEFNPNYHIGAPLWQQAFEFFMEKHYFVNIVEHYDCFIDWHSHTLFLVTPKSKDIYEVRSKALERIIEHYEADEFKRIEIYNEKL